MERCGPFLATVLILTAILTEHSAVGQAQRERGARRAAVRQEGRRARLHHAISEQGDPHRSRYISNRIEDNDEVQPLDVNPADDGTHVILYQRKNPQFRFELPFRFHEPGL